LSSLGVSVPVMRRGNTHSPVICGGGVGVGVGVGVRVGVGVGVGVSVGSDSTFKYPVYVSISHPSFMVLSLPLSRVCPLHPV